MEKREKAKKKQNSTAIHKQKFDYEINDYVVYPSQGVGKIVDLETIKFGNQKKLYYVIQFSNNGLKIKVQTDKVEESNIRPVINKNDVKKVLKILQEEEEELEEDWKIRYQNNLAKIKSGSIYEVAKVCRNLFKRAKNKELSLMERRLYETAYSLLANEISVAKQMNLEDAKNLVSELLSK
ncbi:MAG: CarD family transcriptional regulator [Leptonema sp. (in: bacteria)]